MANDNTFGGITVPRFQSAASNLGADLLKKQLGFVGEAVGGLTPGGLAGSFRKSALRGLEGDSTGQLLVEQTGNPNVGAAFDLSQRNKVSEQYNDLLAFLNSPEGAAELARAKAGLFGPQTLTALNIGNPTPQGPKGQGSVFNQALQIGAAAGSLGWSPF